MNRRWLPVWAAMTALPAAEASGRGASPPRPVQAQPPMAASSEPAERPPLATLRPGTAVKVRIRQVFPCDGLSPGERLLNGRQPIQPGDRFLAEVINPASIPPPLVGGTIVKVTPPGRFGRPGRLTLQMTQLVENSDGTSRTDPVAVRHGGPALLHAGAAEIADEP